MIDTFTCRCGDSVDYDNPAQGCVNISDFQTTTGWFSLFNGYTQGSIWTCPKCAKAALEHAEAIAAILGTKYAYLPAIIGLRDKVGLNNPVDGGT